MPIPPDFSAALTAYISKQKNGGAVAGAADDFNEMFVETGGPGGGDDFYEGISDDDSFVEGGGDDESPFNKFKGGPNLALIKEAAKQFQKIKTQK